jgi:hypothetical protein
MNTSRPDMYELREDLKLTEAALIAEERKVERLEETIEILLAACHAVGNGANLPRKVWDQLKQATDQAEGRTS